MKIKLKRVHFSSIPLGLALGVLVGTFHSSLFVIVISGLTVLAFGFIFCLVNAFIFKASGRICFAFMAGLCLAFMRCRIIGQSLNYLELRRGQTATVLAKVTSNTTTKDKTWRFESSDITIDGQKLDCLAYISLPNTYPKPERGNILTMRATLRDGFGKYALYISRPELVELSKPDPPDYSLMLRKRFGEVLTFLIGPDRRNEVALGLGYLMGEKDGMSPDFNEKLRRVGLAHVVVASGFHLGLITSLARKSFQKISRFAGTFTSVLAIILFVSITGLSASMLRAGLVSGLSLWAGYYGRRFHPGRLLLYVAAISLLRSPHYLLDAAWQLSFAAFAGLLLLAPLLQDFFYGEKPNFIRSSLIQTISAQLCCLPISIYTFGSFSPMGLISSILVSPSIPLAMLLCVVAVIFVGVPGIGSLLAFLARAILSLHVGIINYLNQFDWASQSFESGNAKVFALYLAILALFVFLKFRTKYRFRPLYGKTAVRLAAMEKSQKDGKIYTC